MALAIAIDLGATFLKGAIIDLETTSIVRSVRSPSPAFITGLQKGHFEFDPLAVADAISRLLNELLNECPNCKAIVMCSQMHCLVLVDENGAPQSNAISWMDQRALEPSKRSDKAIIDEMRGALTAEQIAEMGNELRPGFPLSTLYWMDQYQTNFQNNLTALSLPDFVVNRLTRGDFVTEATNAGGYGAFDISRGTWHREAIGKLNLSKVKWPQVVQQGSIVGKFSWNGKSIPCLTPVGDQQAALAGALLQPQEVSLNVATGAQSSRISDTSVTGPYQIRPYFDGKFLNTITHLPGGRELNVLIEVFTELAPGELDPWPLIIERVENTADSDVEVALSFFDNVGCGGSISNLREHNLSLGQIFKAAFSSTASAYWDAAERLRRNDVWRAVVLSGGLIRKTAVLQQMVKTKFACPIRFAPHEEDTIVGLMLLAKHWMEPGSTLSAITEEYSTKTGVLTVA